MRRRLCDRADFAGYVFLVDEHAKIRWAAVGFADESETKSEVASLRACTGVLLKRLTSGVDTAQ